MPVRIDRVRTNGVFTLDGQSFDVENNIWLVGDDRMLWDQVDAARSPDMGVKDGQTFEAGGATLQAIHTPGHSPGGVCLHLAFDGVVFSGDTLFHGGPGATGRSFSDFPTIIESIRTKLLPLPLETVVHTGHGESTTIGEEAPHLDEWIARGH